MLRSAMRYGVRVGAASFALGFFGPMLVDPSSGNGPMLGIFITGPLGFIAGAIWGALSVSAQRRRRRTPL